MSTYATGWVFLSFAVVAWILECAVSDTSDKRKYSVVFWVLLSCSAILNSIDGLEDKITEKQAIETRMEKLPK